MSHGEEFLGQLPPGWTIRRLASLGTLAKATGGSKEDNRQSGVPVVRYGDLYTRFDTTIADAAAFVSEVDAQRYTPLPEGSIVFAASGESPYEIGKSALSHLPTPAVVGGDTVIFHPGDEVDPGYLAHALESKPVKASKAIRATGFTVVHISAGKLKTLPIPLPPLDVQQAIADLLDRETDRIDGLITEQRRLIDLLRERRQALITHVVSRGLDATVPMKVSDLFWCNEVPSHWLIANIRRFATMKTGHTPSRANPEYWVDCDIPWFTLADVWQLRDGRKTYLGDTTNKISRLGIAESAAELLPAGTVVLSRTASVGFAGIMPVPMATSQDFWNWVPGGRLDAAYLMWVFRAMRPEFDALMTGSTHKTIYQPTAASIRIPVPPLDEQRGIAAHLDRQTARIDTLISETERFVELSRERRSALIAAAVTGQVDVRSGDWIVGGVVAGGGRMVADG